MNICPHLRDQLDWRTNDEASPELPEHIAQCPSCQDTVLKWRAIEHEINKIDRESIPISVHDSSAVAEFLVKRANSGRTTSRVRQVVVAAAAVAAMVVASMAYLTTTSEGPPTPGDIDGKLFGAGIIASIDGEIAVDNLTEGNELTVPEGARGRFELGDDRFALGENSRVRIGAAKRSVTRINIDRGQVACSVKHRSAGQKFEVKSGDVLVRVVGTRFSVARDEDATVSITVDEGEVQVISGAGKYAVRKGNRLKIAKGGNAQHGALTQADQLRLRQLLDDELRPEQELLADNEQNQPVLDEQEPMDEMIFEDVEPRERTRNRNRHRPSSAKTAVLSNAEKWRQAIIEGRFNETRDSLKSHLAKRPADIEAWRLLADCERKSGSWNGAINAYQRIIELGGAAERRRAQFRAGAICQDKLGDHRRAASYLERYVASPGGRNTMKAEGMVRLAKSYLKMGKRLDAKKQLETVTRVHQGTTAAEKAQNILNANW